MDFPCGPAGKESACNVGDLGLIPGRGTKGASPITQLVKNPPAMQETPV